MTRPFSILQMLGLILITAALCAACSQGAVYNPNKDEVDEAPTLAYTIKIIDGCEYIETQRGGYSSGVYSLTHKGNCKNVIHILK